MYIMYFLLGFSDRNWNPSNNNSNNNRIQPAKS